MSFFSGRDGARLAYRVVGAGRPLVLLHGFQMDGTMWLRAGQAEELAAHGFGVILPDFRGHGASARPHESSAYPPDVLVDDGLALIEQLGLEDYDLAGSSLGGRIVGRLLVRGATPRRAIIAAQGLNQFTGAGEGVGSLMRRVLGGGTFEAGSAEAEAEHWLRVSGADPTALLHVLDSLVPTSTEDLGRVRVPTLVVMGTDDERRASADQFVAALPHSTYATVPGNHWISSSSAELVATMIAFLTED
ncbi:alpha/beta hydrolase [Kribbella sp. NPDC026611]|uniref:alpha/beta fold hydrolase n=1 Tax=Kribbella sp. NPDC026611 TaxID=3154911 RepID=UPI0033DE01A7